MTQETYDLVAYWGPRQETPAACAMRFAQMAARLAEIDPVFTGWLYQADRGDVASRAEALARSRKLPLDLDSLTRIFEAGRSYRYDPPVLWPELGFRIGAWNDHDDRYGVAMRVHPGSYAAPMPRASAIDITIGDRRLMGDQAWTGSMLAPVLMAVVDAWKPSFAAVRSGRHGIYLVTPKASKNWSAPGWLTYVAFPYSLRLNPPRDVEFERLAGGGLLTTLCEEPFDIDNPRHMALADDMQKALTPVQW